MTLPPPVENETESGMTLGKVIRIVLIVYALLVFVPLIIGVIAAATDMTNAAERLIYLRDLLWVIVLLLTVPVLVGLGVLLIQIAALFGVIRVDVGAVLGEARGALKAIGGAFRFVAETVAAPIIKVWSWMSMWRTFTRDLGRIFTALRRPPTPPSDDATPEG